MIVISHFLNVHLISKTIPYIYMKKRGTKPNEMSNDMSMTTKLKETFNWAPRLELTHDCHFTFSQHPFNFQNSFIHTWKEKRH
jgi:hypothetical protein